MTSSTPKFKIGDYVRYPNCPAPCCVVGIRYSYVLEDGRDRVTRTEEYIETVSPNESATLKAGRKEKLKMAMLEAIEAFNAFSAWN